MVPHYGHIDKLVAENNQLIQRIQRLESALEVSENELSGQASLLIKKSIDLIEINEVKSRYYASVSNEFRTPLTLILGPLQDALDGLLGPVSDQMRIQMSVMQQNGLRLLRQINQLMDLSRLELGKVSLQALRAPINPFLADISNCFQAIAAQKQIDFSIQLEDFHGEIYFDPDKLEKIIYNLLSVAFHSTPAGGRVVIGISQAKADVVVSVSDSGEGIPAERLPFVFDRFVHGSTENTYYGIRLALAKELVELHGGKIEVESSASNGNVFTVILPMGSNHLRSDQKIQDDSLHTYSGLRTIQSLYPARGVVPKVRKEEQGYENIDAPLVLVVDENKEIREYIAEHLSGTYRVKEASDGYEALELASEIIPDIILTDVVLPGLDGITLCEKLRKNEVLDFVPVILITGKASSDERLNGLKGGEIAYLTKPFSAHELKLQVDNLMRTRNRLQKRILNKNSNPEKYLQSTKVSVQSAENVFLAQVRTIVEANMGEDTFSVAGLAAELGLSRVHLYRRLQSQVGKSPAEMIRSIRLDRAAQLLSAHAGSVSEIGYGVGFKSISHFSKCFKDVYSVSPSVYMMQQIPP